MGDLKLRVWHHYIFLASIYIARSINPAHFIQLSIIFSILSLLNVLIDCGLSGNLLLVNSLRNDVLSVHESEMYKRSFLLFILYLIFVFFFSSVLDLSVVLLLIPSFLIIVYPYNFCGNLLFNRKQMFKEKLLLSFIASFVSSVIAVLLTYSSLPALALVFSQIIAPFVLAVSLRIRLKLPLLPPVALLSNCSFSALCLSFSSKYFSSSFSSNCTRIFLRLLSKCSCLQYHQFSMDLFTQKMTLS